MARSSITVTTTFILDDQEIGEVVGKELFEITAFGVEVFLRPATPVLTGRLKNSERALEPFYDKGSEDVFVDVVAEDYFKFVDARRGFSIAFVEYMENANIDEVGL